MNQPKTVSSSAVPTKEAGLSRRRLLALSGGAVAALAVPTMAATAVPPAHPAPTPVSSPADLEMLNLDLGHQYLVRVFDERTFQAPGARQDSRQSGADARRQAAARFAPRL